MSITLLNNAKNILTGNMSSITQASTGIDSHIPSIGILNDAIKNEGVIGNVMKSIYKGEDPSSLLTYIPSVNLTELIANPKSYVKNRIRIAEKMVRGRVRQGVLDYIDSLLENKKTTIKVNDSVKDTKENIKKLVDENTPVLNIKGYTDLNGDALRQYIQLSCTEKSSNGKSTTYNFVDGHAVVKISEAKNILMTKVQGRDLTRKEYISGGDYNITISGKIVSDYPDVYPTKEVVDLKNILKHKDVIECHSPFLNIFEVYTILVTDYSIPQNEEYSNVQDYSITAVYEKPIEALKYESRNVSQILSAKEEMQKAIEANSSIYKIDETTMSKATTKLTLKELLNKVNPKLFVQQQSWI